MIDLLLDLETELTIDRELTSEQIRNFQERATELIGGKSRGYVELVKQSERSERGAKYSLIIRR